MKIITYKEESFLSTEKQATNLLFLKNRKKGNFYQFFTDLFVRIEMYLNDLDQTQTKI